MDNSTNPRAKATAALAEMFFEAACAAEDMSGLESDAIGLGHACMADALGLALEALDAKLLSERPEGLRAHDMRLRTLATEVGDVSFSIRRYRDRCGKDAYLLADALDIPYGCRISPGAREFLVEAASHVSYAKAAKLLARHGSKIRPTAVMGVMRQAGALAPRRTSRPRNLSTAMASCRRPSRPCPSSPWRPTAPTSAPRACRKARLPDSR